MQGKKQGKQKPKENLCDKRCESCIYHVKLCTYPDSVGCYYIVYNFKRRPCPAGKECTAYIRGKSLEGNKKKMPTLLRKQLMHCQICGREIYGNCCTKYCAECAKKREKENKDAFYAKEKEARHQALYNLDRKCMACGKVYHSDKSSVHYCEDCQKLSKFRRKMLRLKTYGAD